MPSIKWIHHIAIVVNDMEESLSFWRDALGIPLDHIKDVTEQESQVAFLPIGNSLIELVKPTTQNSGVARYLAKRGPGMHHLCIEVDNIENMLVKLRNKGMRVINDSSLISQDGTKYVFIHPESTGGVLVELYESQKEK